VSRKSSRRPALRGLVTRFSSIVLGAVVAGGLIVSLQLPFLHGQPTVRLSLHPYASFDYTPPPLIWPSQGSAAVDVPALGVTRVWHNRVVPIASLTKMMTAYVALKRFPLAIGQTGPCIVVMTTTSAVMNWTGRRRLGSPRHRRRTTL